MNPNSVARDNSFGQNETPDNDTFSKTLPTDQPSEKGQEATTPTTIPSWSQNEDGMWFANEPEFIPTEYPFLNPFVIGPVDFTYRPRETDAKELPTTKPTRRYPSGGNSYDTIRGFDADFIISECDADDLDQESVIVYAIDSHGKILAHRRAFHYAKDIREAFEELEEGILDRYHHIRYFERTKNPDWCDQCVGFHPILQHSSCTIRVVHAGAVDPCAFQPLRILPQHLVAATSPNPASNDNYYTSLQRNSKTEDKMEEVD